MRHRLFLFMPIMPISLIVLVSVVVAQLSGTPRLESFWPVSLVAYMTAVSQVLMWLAWMAQRRKDDKSPIYEKLDEQTAAIKEDIGRVRMEIKRVEHDFANEIAVAQRDIGKDINGLGGRITNAEQSIGIVTGTNSALDGRMVRSEMDRADLRKEIDRSRAEFLEFRSEILRELRANRRSNKIARAQILAAIATMRVTGNTPAK
jgi:hypothetical protein